MSKQIKTIGILGGMGPLASANLYQKIITIAQTEYHASQDIDFPPMIINSLPLYGFDETGVVDGELVKIQLIAGVKMLEQAGSDLIIIACNTVHCYFREMQAAINIPIINILEVVVGEVLSQKLQRVGVLSSGTTNKLKLYENILTQNHIETIVPTENDQNTINNTILKAMSGTHGQNEKDVLKNIIIAMGKNGAEAVVLGCTELPLILQSDDSPLPIIDSNYILAKSALKASFHN